MRRMLRALPQERLLWCSLKAVDGKLPSDLPRHMAVVASALHWRLRNSVLGYVWDFELMSRGLAREIADKCQAFQPEVIWVLPELLAIPVGYHLARTLRLPLHATVYDAPESAGVICVPQLYFQRYMRHAVRLCRELASADAVSDELLHHVRLLHGPQEELPGLSIPPSLPAFWMHKPRSVHPWKADGRRVIGFCGSFRVMDSQWRHWLSLLGGLPWQIELLAFASPDTVPSADLPVNVNWRLLPYVDDEREIIECFAREGVHACYLGLRRSPQWGLFNRTSLSSKLATYLAAAIPVIVDAPEDSVAWRLVRQYNAGLWIDAGEGGLAGGGQKGGNHDALCRLLSDEVVWRASAMGAARLCAEYFTLGVNAEKLTLLLARVAARGRGAVGDCR